MSRLPEIAGIWLILFLNSAVGFHNPSFPLKQQGIVTHSPEILIFIIVGMPFDIESQELPIPFIARKRKMYQELAMDGSRKIKQYPLNR